MNGCEKLRKSQQEWEKIASKLFKDLHRRNLF